MGFNKIRSHFGIQILDRCLINFSGDWKSTNKDNIFVKFSSDGDGADSMHSTAFDLEWECEGTPDLSDSFGTCEVTDSVFGTVGWKIKDKKRYFAKVSLRY